MINLSKSTTLVLVVLPTARMQCSPVAEQVKRLPKEATPESGIIRQKISLTISQRNFMLRRRIDSVPHTNNIPRVRSLTERITRSHTVAQIRPSAETARKLLLQRQADSVPHTNNITGEISLTAKTTWSYTVSQVRPSTETALTTIIIPVEKSSLSEATPETNYTQQQSYQQLLSEVFSTVRPSRRIHGVQISEGKIPRTAP